MAAISIRITTATYANGGTACTNGPVTIDAQNGDQTLWYNDDDGNSGTLSLSNLPVGGLQLYLNESAANTNDGSTDIWSGTSTYYYCDTEGTSPVDCAIEVIDTGKIGDVTYCSPTVTDGTETVATGGSIDIDIHELISDNIDDVEDLTIDLAISTLTLGTLDTYNSETGLVQYNAGSTAGTETIEFTATDQNGNESRVGEITITITQANTAPTTVTANLTVASGSVTTINLNDYIDDSEDADGDLVLELTQTVDVGSLDFSVNDTITDNEIVFTAPTVAYGDPNETTQFTYSVQDTGGLTATADGEVNLTITAAANTDPVASDSQTLTVNSGGTLSTDLSSLVTDNEENSQALTYTIETNPPSGEGSVSIVNGYVGQYQAPTVPFGNSAVTTSYTYRVTDNGGLFDTGIINIQVNAAANTPPSFESGNLQPSIPFNDNTLTPLSFTFSDLEQEAPLSVTVTQQPPNGTVTVISTTAVSQFITQCQYTFTPDTGATGQQPFTLTLDDGSGGTTAQPFTAQITAPAYISFAAGTYQSTGDLACIEEANDTVWVATGGTIFSIGDLGPGVQLYETSGSGNPYAPGIQSFIKLEDVDGTIFYFEVDPNGVIISSPQTCGLQSGLAVSSNVYYTASESLMCDKGADIVSVWYSVNDANASESLATLVGSNINLFINEYYANLYANGLNPDLEGLIPVGLYAENTVYDNPSILVTYYKRSIDNTWVYDQSGSILWSCPKDPIYVYHEGEIFIPFQDNCDREPIWNFCNGIYNFGNIWYASEISPSGQGGQTKTLLEIVQENLPVYQSQVGVEGELIEDLLPSGTYGDASGFAVWTNGGDGSNFQWYAFNANNQFVEGQQATQLGTCTEWNDRPEPLGDGLSEELEWNAGVNDTNVFYAFLACAPQSETDNDTGLISNYWQLYVIDSLYDIVHTINSDGSHVHEDLGGSYVKDLVEFIKSNPLTTHFKSSAFCECLQYLHTIYAEDINDAVQTLKSFGYESTYSNVEIATVNPQDIGIASEQTISLYESCDDCMRDFDDQGATETYEIPQVDDAILSPLSPNFNTETNYKLDNISKPLLRTNPKLTTNVKLVVNSTDNLYLESINATKELAAVEYKKFPVSENGQYSFDVARFYNVNRTPNEMMFATKRDYSDLTVLDSYDKQLEESYHYGTTYNYSKLHSEDFRLFAPIWLDRNIPKRFVIFKVKDPSATINYNDSAADNFSRIQEMLRSAEIVKTYDLSNKSKIGKYLRNHIQSETIPSAPITVNFEKNEKSTYNGIDLIKGGFSSKGEYLYKDFTLSDKPLIESNDFITDGFKRNQLASANIINLEFLFNDDSAEEYSANRYFGLYVDDIDSGRGRVFNVVGKTHELKDLVSYVDPTHPNLAIPSHKMISTMPVLAYARIQDLFFRLSSDTYYNADKSKVAIEDNLNQIPSFLGIKKKNKSIDILPNSEHGYDFIKMNVVDIPNTNDSVAISVIKEEANKFKFVKHTSGQAIEVQLDNMGDLYTLTFTTGSTIQDTFANIEAALTGTDFAKYVAVSFDDNSFYLTEIMANLGELAMQVTNTGTCIIKNSRIQTSVDFQNHVYFAEYSIDPGKFSGVRFSNQGTTTNVAVALAACINANETSFRAYNVGTYVYVVNTVPGYKLSQSTFLLSNGNVVEFLELENRDITNELTLRKGDGDGTAILENYTAYYLSGGNSGGKSIFVNNETISEISIGDYLETRYVGVYNRVLDIVEDITRPNSQYAKVILEDKNDLSRGEANVFYENEISLGLFSAYNMYDMNFDFYDTSNSDLKELKHETREEINYEPYEAALNSVDPDTNTETTFLNSTDIFDTGFALDPINYFSNLSGLLNEEEVEETNTDQISSEYDRLKENEVKRFAINSRVTPNINKWVLKDTVTVREQPYYLNVNEAFGRTNFSPDLTVKERNKDAMTHEWFYMEKMPKYLRYDQFNDTFSYINFIEGFELTPNMFKSVNYDYFSKFMVSDGFEKTLNKEDLIKIYETIESGDSELNSITEPANIDSLLNTFIKTELKKKYSIVSGGNDVSFASTIFKGIKVDFKNRKEFVNETATEFVKGTEFNGYRFSTMLKVNESADSNSVEFEVIQNKKFKFIIFFITLNLSEFWVKGNMNRKLLYELNHKIVYDTLEDEYVFANTPVEGALNLNDSNIDWNSDGPYTISGLQHANGSLPNFESQIALGEGGLYGDVHIVIFPQTVNQKTYKLSIVSVESDSTIIVSGKPVNVVDSTDILQVEFLPDSVQLQATYTYIGGGANAHKIILEELTASAVSDLINLNNSLITYSTINEDGTLLNNRFVINFSDGKEVVKKSSLTIEEDNDKPKSYKLFNGTIGYNIVQDANEYFPFLIRHSGNYTVDLNPVVTFTDTYTHFKVNRNQITTDDNEWTFKEVLYKHSQTDLLEVNRAKAYYNKYNRCGISFNLGFIQDEGVHDGNWGVINNHYYHKVNEINPGGVTKLSTTSDKAPLYPLIGEIAIDKKDINVFRSSWDFDYYNRSLAGGGSIAVPGTFETKEERSYLASTIMKPKELYTLLDYTWSSVASAEELDEILINGNNTTDIVIFEDDTNVIADFYITDVLTKKMVYDGVLSTISKYVIEENSAGNKETLLDDAQLYVKNNLIGTYILADVDLYVKRFKGAESKIDPVADITLLTSDGFTQDQNNYAYRSHVQKPMNFRLIYNKRLGYSYDIRPVIKIKS